MANPTSALDFVMSNISGRKKPPELPLPAGIPDEALGPFYARKIEVLRYVHNLHECDDSECLLCGVLYCVDHEPLHFHHDGCPSCTPESERFPESKP